MKLQFIIHGIRRAHDESWLRENSNVYVCQQLGENAEFGSFTIAVEAFGPTRLPLGTRFTVETEPPQRDEQGVNSHGLLGLKAEVERGILVTKGLYPGLSQSFAKFMATIQGYIDEPTTEHADALRKAMEKYATGDQWGVFAPRPATT